MLSHQEAAALNPGSEPSQMTLALNHHKCRALLVVESIHARLRSAPAIAPTRPRSAVLKAFIR